MLFSRSKAQVNVTQKRDSQTRVEIAPVENGKKINTLSLLLKNKLSVTHLPAHQLKYFLKFD